MEYNLALKTWFKPHVMERAHTLIRKGQGRHLLFFRQSAALICADEITATVNIATGTGRHRFVFRDGWCSQCVAGASGSRCQHVTALAMLCLRRHNEKLQPVTITFADSPWQKIGRYLSERLHSGQTEISWHNDGGKVQLIVRHKSGLSLDVVLDAAAASELQALGMGSRGKTSPDNLFESLADRLARQTATENERALLDRGSTTKQMYNDKSCWMWLARLLSLHVSGEDISVGQDIAGQFLLQTSGSAPLFRLLLPRQHSWVLLDQFALERHGFTRLPPAEQFNSVSFSDDGSSIEVENWCRLSDGSTHKLADLKENAYGSRYCLDSTYFSLASIPAKERIDENAKKTLSLFAMATPDRHRSTGFTVYSDTLPDFLQRNRQALKAKRHQVAPEILEMEVVNEPKALQLTDFKEEMDWCYLAGYYELGNQQIDLAELLQATEHKQQYIPGRRWFDLHSSPLHWFHALGEERLMDNGRIKLTRQEFMLLGNQVQALSADVEQEKQGKTLSFLLEHGNSQDTPVLTDKQSGHLRGYQINGVDWMSKLHYYGLGCILADDMGLGKTHQALAFIDLVTDESESVLIVCPAAVLYHWPQKQEEFFPQLGMSVYHGGRRDLVEAKKSRIIVTTYGVLRQDIDELQLINFKLIIFDEMHYLKNKKTSLFQAAGCLQAETIIGLTGTPVENNIQEVENLLAICLPDIFNAGPVHQLFEEAETAEDRQRVQRLIAPFILRRTRKQVLQELPECSEDIRFCELSEDQVGAYRQAVTLATEAVEGLLNGEPIADFTHILTTIIRLKQICNHLCQLEGCTDWTLYHSGKWDEFTRLIRQCMESHLKVVIFSQFTSMLDIIEAWLNQEKIDHVSVRGRVGAKERSKRIQRFNTVKKCKICCASLLAGGTGIDLTGAQVVIHYDRWWNPAKEEQATARVHRMGQIHPVQVYKLVTVGTLEEKIHHLIEQKRALAAELIVEDDGSILKALSREDLADLFNYG
jgi:superfamily II DNA or RNA helicase